MERLLVINFIFLRFEQTKKTKKNKKNNNLASL